MAKSFWFEGIEKRERLTIPVVDHRPSSLVCRARSPIGGPTTELWLGSLKKKSPSWIYPTSDHMPWWSYHWGQLFSQQNQPWPSMLDSSIIPAAHQNLASIKWHYLHERQLPNNLSPILPFNLQSRACKEGGEERKDMEGKKKKREKFKCHQGKYPSCSQTFIFHSLKSSHTPPTPPPPTHIFFFSLSLMFYGVQEQYGELSSWATYSHIFSTSRFLVGLADQGLMINHPSCS